MLKKLIGDGGRAVLLLSAATFAAAAVSSEWKFTQEVQVPAPGVTRATLPLETISKSQLTLADLRLVDPAGQPVSFLIDRPSSVPAHEWLLASMNMSLSKGKTVITGRVPADLQGAGIEAIHLFSPTDDFLKALTLEASRDGRQWKTLLRQYPIFKQPGQATSTAVEVPPGAGSYLRMTLDDAGTPPIRIEGVSVVGGAKPLSGLESVEAKILDVTSDAHQTDVELELPADHLTIDSIRLEASDATFRRPITVLNKVFVNGAFAEETLGRGLVYRVALGGPQVEQLSVPVGRQVAERRITLRIENGDSRPLDLTRVSAQRVPLSLVFHAAVSGRYTLWVGNPAAAMPNYDVAALSGSLAKNPFAAAGFEPLAANPAYQAPEPLPQVSEEGADLDVSMWKYRKKVTLLEPGIQRVEMDLESIAHNNNHPAALRLVRDGKQIPYVTDLTGIGRQFQPRLDPLPMQNQTSRWTVVFPYKRTPVQQLRFTVAEPFFQRAVSVYEEQTDDRGESVRETLGQAEWTRMNGESKDGFILELSRAPSSDRILLEIANGDNAPLHLTGVRGYYQAPRLLFKASPASQPLYLYYGQEDIAPPQYDLSLVAADLQASVPIDAQLGAEEILKVQPWYDVPLPDGKMRLAFWVGMILVVVGLLMVIAKLLPAEAQP